MNKEPIHVIALGAGVQSSTDAIMAARGDYKDLNGNVQVVSAAIFCDTKAEPKSVMVWLDYLEETISKLPYAFPIYRVSVGSLENDSLVIRKSKKTGRIYIANKIPAFLKDYNGKMGLFGLICTSDYKIIPLQRKVKELLGIKRASKKDTRKAFVRIGITTDEAHRMKPSREHYIENIRPLIDAGFSRKDCINWMAANGYPEPPRSSCVFCPFHSDAEWERLRTKEPEDFERAAKFELKLQEAASKQEVLKGIPFLHSSGKLISEIDFKAKLPGYEQISLFGNECEGLCGV